jgi:hypothetical protein
VISEEEGIKAVVGKLKGEDKTTVQSYLFDKAKGWNLEKAKTWFEKHREGLVKEHVSVILPFQVLEKIVDKPLRIRGIAITSGMSRNFNVYTPEELQNFANKLVSAPVYVEHVAVPNAIGKVTKTEWDGQNLWYEAEIYDDETTEKIRKGLIQHVSVGADYETLDILDGKVPHGLHNAELSLVAVPGIPETNIQVMEKLQTKEQAFPLRSVALINDFKVDGKEYITPGEYVLGFHRDPYAFLPEHFSTIWLDRENGILALIGRLRNQPESKRIQSILFSKEKMWNENKIRDWFLLHPHYLVESKDSTPIGDSANQQTQTKEHEKSKENEKPQTEKPKDEPSNLAESLLKEPPKNEPAIPVKEAISLIQSVLPSPVVERSWSFGPQRLCQELRGVVRKLESQSQKVTVGSKQDELLNPKQNRK